MIDPAKLQVSLALKAARWLAGGADDKGRATPLTTTALARRPQLVENQITKNRLEEIEQMRATARPMELDQIGRAVGLDVALLVEQVAFIDQPPETNREPPTLPGEAAAVAADAAPLSRAIESTGPRAPDRSESPPATRRRRTA